MREIKFRGYNTQLNQWLYGYYVKHIDETFNPLGRTKEEIDEWYKEHTKHYIVQDAFSDWDMPRDLQFNAIDEYSIGQFTECYDCNNTEIYEGDIVKYKGEEGVIEYLNGSFIIVLEEEIVYLYEIDNAEEQIIVKGNNYETEKIR